MAADYNEHIEQQRFEYALYLKKVPAFKLSATLPNLNPFSKLLHCWKACEICYKTTQHYPSHLRHAATLPWDTKNLNSLQIFSRYGEYANKLHFQCTDFYSSTRITVLNVFMCMLYQNLVLVAEWHVDCWQTLQWRLLWRISGATDWSQT